ncbi:MAG: hypothetical protein AAF927_00250 [Bacteroidota bacterium]
MSRPSHIARYLTLGGFVCFLGFAWLGFFFRPGTSPSGQAFPEINWEFLDPAPAKIDQWWAANFGGQEVLSGAYHQLNPDLKKLSPQPQKVIMGQEDWLFHAEKPIAQFRQTQVFSDYELSVLRRKLQQRITNYQQLGAAFQLYIIPNKVQVYPEYLPPYFQAGQGKTQAEQVVGVVNELEGAQAYYLREALRQAKPKGRLYDKTDTHWNDRGAFEAYQFILHKIAGSFPSTESPHPIKDFELSSFKDKGRNLARMLGMSEQYEEEAVRLIPQYPLRARAHMPYQVGVPTDFIFADQYFMGFQHPKAKGPRLLFIRDSFSTQLILTLSEHFTESYFLWDQWRYASNQAIVNQVKPEAVVVIMLEEHLGNLLRFD